MRVWLKSLLQGVTCSAGIVLIAAVLGANDFPILLQAWLVSGLPLGLLAIDVLPDAFAYWLHPAGGGPAFVGTLVLVSFSQNTALLTAGTLWCNVRRARKAALQNASTPF